jgi:hypothetical protein
MTFAPRRCARCGADVLPILDLAMTAARAKRALETMRLAIPSDVSAGVKALASGLACYSQTCTPTIPRAP